MPADDSKLRNQKNRRDKIIGENQRLTGWDDGVHPWKLHTRERSYKGRGAQKCKGDGECDFALRLSSGQVSEHYTTLVNLLGQRSLPKAASEEYGLNAMLC